MALAARHLPNYKRTTVAMPRVADLPRPGIRGLGLGATALFLVFLVDALLHPRAFFDLALMKAIQTVSLPGLHPGVDFVNELTGSRGAIAVWAVSIALFAGLRWWIPALGMMTLPVGGVINEAVGALLVTRTRPHLAELARDSGNHAERSFPSGHVMGAVMFYGFLFVVAGRIGFRPLRLAVRSGALAVLAAVGFSRVWDGAHWPTDVLGAYALGAMALSVLLALYARLDAAVGHLPLIRAERLAHDETRPHAHALTSLVLFERDTVAKVYAPGLIPTAIYWLAFQAPFPYVRNRAALKAAVQRRNLAALLTRAWYGEARVARALGVETIGGREALVSERIAGGAPTDRAKAKAFLTDLRTRFEAAGLPTWQIDPRQPRAIDNVLETPDGRYVVVDLESGLVSPMASKLTWTRALRRGLIPFYDEVFFDVTRAYVAQTEGSLRAALGEDGFADLEFTLDAAERDAAAWHATEPRLWSKALRFGITWFSVRAWKTRLAGGHEKGNAWIEQAVATWEAEGRISAPEAATLRTQIAEPTFQLMLPYLGAQILVSIPLRFPFGSIVRPLMVLGALGAATVKLARRRIDGAAWKRAWSIHSPLVMLLSAVPGFGSFAYLAAKPVRANRLLLRAVGDAALQKVPWNLAERTGLRRIVTHGRPAQTAAPRRHRRPRLVATGPYVPASSTEAVEGAHAA
ncbi:MAG: hypothetical protein AVDCRST_MAG73-3670 [uncultured Thermomicrobiales bacterium]|uniref:Phosphatidic acid phosphatase type 2/haloperoxidase domain-containing protein n=1 Tax=uncultured Thermomicrobiales bacterium TaxID=1645740 RepID=A0A6J4UUB0_9BACT|nr:MAG: hypothetical protein AVDCRST_MAG73-3670 [uncultured Thermomicrobiales bacterium]